ncbi:MAG: GDSL-type esterase/lipase family protein [Caulobacteraceae bacterium]
MSGRNLCAWAAVTGLCLVTTPGMAEVAVGPTAMVADPCAGLVDHPMDATLLPMLQPGAKIVPPPPDPAAARAAAELRAKDWPDLCRYQAANAALKQTPRAVFMGDSITEAWGIADPGFFSGDFVDRGISGQTSPQMLLRFRADVIALKPRVVHILAGTNDVAGNTGPTSERAFEDNIETMVDLAKANHIQVVIASILPMDAIGWRPEYRPAEEVRRLNAWLRDYSAKAAVSYLDYYSALVAPDGGFRRDLSNDGVHPNLTGYAIMRRMAAAAIGRD